MKTLLLGLLLILSGCSYIPRPVPTSDNPVIIAPFDLQSSSDSWSVKAVMAELSDHPGVAQEVRMSTGQQLVEYFLTPCGVFPQFRYDHHWRGPAFIETRECLVYPATVDGVDWDGFWCMLPANMAGNMVTNVGPDFNADYQARHSICGRIIAEDRTKAQRWRIRWEAGVVTVWCPNNKVLRFPE